MRRPPLKVLLEQCNLGQRRGGLGRHHPRRGTHLPERTAPASPPRHLDPQGRSWDPIRVHIRWQVRTHLGVDDTTPAPVGRCVAETAPHQPALYDKPSPTFVDAIALARRHRLASEGFSLSVAPRHSGTPGRTVPPTCRFPCLRRLNCVKPSLGMDRIAREVQAVTDGLIRLRRFGKRCVADAADQPVAVSERRQYCGVDVTTTRARGVRPVG